ncbi:MAG: DUF3037 domain-containing protein [Ignavibacteria bacterium]
MQNHFYDYAVIRIVPKVDREEFINAGVILSCPEKEFLEACIDLDEKRLKVFSPGIDIELVKTHLAAIKAICAGSVDAGTIGKLSQRERFHWLTSPKSTIIQTSPVHSGYCKDPAEELKDLINKMVKVFKRGID